MEISNSPGLITRQRRLRQWIAITIMILLIPACCMGQLLYAESDGYPEVFLHILPANARIGALLDSLPISRAHHVLIGPSHEAEWEPQHPHCIFGAGRIVLGANEAFEGILADFSERMIALGWEEQHSENAQQASYITATYPGYVSIRQLFPSEGDPFGIEATLTPLNLEQYRVFYVVRLDYMEEVSTSSWCVP